MDRDGFSRAPNLYEIDPKLEKLHVLKKLISALNIHEGAIHKNKNKF